MYRSIQWRSILLFLLFNLVCFQPSLGILEWLFGDEKETENHVSEGTNGDNQIRFEVLSSDEKFLDFARTLNDLSPLDACHNLVIYSLKKKCGDLTEEELGKLSVQLLNCQSEAEDRPVFTCTSSMLLADCTKSMDGTTWNSYQIVGNRARAMCYATQQVQFRRLTEVTVNRLINSASEQVKTLQDLKNGQEQLHSLTFETVRKLYESQQDLLSTQHSLRDAHEDIFKHIATNVKEIMQEKALIASGNRELAFMTENIKEKLDATAQQIKEREEIEHQKHEGILLNLKNIQTNTEASVYKLDNSLKKLLNKYEELDAQYTGMSSNLRKMNTTMVYLMSTVNLMQEHLDNRINWISKLLGGADDKLSAMSCCLLHIAYFFLLAVAATFLQISVPIRLTMLMVIVGNVAAELNYDISMDFAGLTVFLFTLYFGFKLVVHMGSKFYKGQPTDFSWQHSVQSIGSGPTRASSLSSEEMNSLLNLLHRFVESLQQNTPESPVANGTVIHETSFQPATPPSSHDLSLHDRVAGRPVRASVIEDRSSARRILLDDLGLRGSPSSSRASTPLHDSRSSTPSISSRCLASTIAGTQCRLPAALGSDFCRRHVHR